MREFTVNLRMTYADKNMLLQASQFMEMKSMNKFVLMVMRGECKYNVWEKGENIGKQYAEVPDCTESYHADEGLKLMPTIMSIGMQRWEAVELQAYARERHYAGVPSFILDVLRKKGLIVKKSIVSDSETTNRMEEYHDKNDTDGRTP